MPKPRPAALAFGGFRALLDVMNILIGALIVVVACSVAVGAVLFVRQRAPEGGYFNDSDRAAGVFGVLATGFALLLGFVIFLAFTSYDSARAGAETEALVLLQQYETAQFLPGAAEELTGELVCYGRTVVEQEWPQMEESGAGQEGVSSWGLELFQTVVELEPGDASEEAAYARWLDQTSEREEARLDRLHGAEGIMPSPLWIVLLVSYLAIALFMMFFADSGERAAVQALQVGSVIALMTVMLLTIRFLNQPFHDGVGGLQPVAMERTLRFVEGLPDVGVQGEPPCDEAGRPL
jgi:hypothetical protein